MVRRRRVLGWLAALGAPGLAAQAAAQPAGCRLAPASRLSGSGTWMMETLWAYRVSAEGAYARPMGFDQPVELRSGANRVTVDFIHGDVPVRRVPGGLDAVESAAMREDLLRGLEALGAAGCPPESFTLFTSRDPGPGLLYRNALIPVTPRSAVAVRFIDQPNANIPFRDREVFLLRARG